MYIYNSIILPNEMKAIFQKLYKLLSYLKYCIIISPKLIQT